MKPVDRLKDLFANFQEKHVKRKLLTTSEVFCMAPWIQLHAQTNGKVSPCCSSFVTNGNELGDLRNNPDLGQTWNGENMKQLRLNMLQGKKNSICTHCYEYERLGKFSERMQYNRDYKSQFPKITSTLPDGSLKGMDILVLDIRFSNKCNYKCRICDSDYSSLWYEEELQIGREGRLAPITSKENKVAIDEVAFWKSYKDLLPGVERLHFAGGEPLFMDEHYQTLEHLIAIGRTDVALSYNTNLSTLRYKKYNVVDLWNKFKKVDVWASLDGMGAQGDYQRKGQRWKQIEENISILKRECPAVIFGVNSTVSIFNVLHIPAFYQYMVEQKLVLPERMNLYLLFSPSYFNITNLTPRLKKTVIKQFENFESTYLNTLPGSSNIKNHIHAVTAFMLSATGIEQKDFQHWVNAVDGVREESFTATFPELVEMMEADTLFNKN